MIKIKNKLISGGHRVSGWMRVLTPYFVDFLLKNSVKLGRFGSSGSEKYTLEPTPGSVNPRYTSSY